MDWLWVGIGCGSLCFLSVVALVIWVLVVSAQVDARDKKILEEGTVVKMWIVMANTSLFEVSDSTSFNYAQVVFVMDQSLRDMDEHLERVGMRLGTFDPVPGDETEQTINHVMTTHAPYVRPLLIPSRLIDGVETYTISMRVYWERLPERKLTLPYVYAKVMLGDQGDAVQIDYPSDDVGAKFGLGR